MALSRLIGKSAIGVTTRTRAVTKDLSVLIASAPILTTCTSRLTERTFDQGGKVEKGEGTSGDGPIASVGMSSPRTTRFGTEASAPVVPVSTSTKWSVTTLASRFAA